MKKILFLTSLLTVTTQMTAANSKTPKEKLKEKLAGFKAARTPKNSSHNASLPTGEKVRKAADVATAKLTPQQMATISTEDMVALVRKNLPNNGVAAEQNIRDVARLIKNRAEQTVTASAVNRTTLGN